MRKRKNKSTVFIYIIYFSTSNRRYIGQTQNLGKRIDEHLKANSFVGKALRKYNDWIVTELHAVDDEWANTLEIAEIAWYNSMAPNGYNLMMGGGEGTRGLKWSEESRKKLSKNNPSHRSEVREKIRKIKKGKKNPKISEALKGNKKLRESKLGDKNPAKRPTVRKKLSDAAKRRKVSEETKVKIGTSMKKYHREKLKIGV